MTCPVQDLQWPNGVESVKARVESEENLDDGGRTVWPVCDCTHFGILMVLKQLRLEIEEIEIETQKFEGI